MSHRLYETLIIKNNFDEFLSDCQIIYDDLVKEIGEETTWNYNTYNLFAESSTSIMFYDLYKDLCHVVRDYNRFIGGTDNDRIWIEAWLNFHSQEDVRKLDWHGHEYDFHGYISVDPKKTKTVFPNFEIENKVGQIYIGPCGKEYNHKVEVLEPFEGKRITIAFNCAIEGNKCTQNKLYPVL